MSGLRLTLACGNYDRTERIRNGTIPIEGVDLNYISIGPVELFFRMARYQDFDVSEMSLSTYVIGLTAPNPRLIAIPVFPSRAFRHSCIYINKDSGVKTPGDLRDKKVGVYEYQATANVWIRGMLAEMYDVPLSRPTYYIGGLDYPSYEERLPLNLSKNTKVVHLGPNHTLSNALESGEIDALYSPDMPSCFARGSPKVGRLFADFREAEKEYYKATKIFPIMHTLVMRKEIYESNRWLALSLYKAFLRAKQKAIQELGDVAALKSTLPWLWAEVEHTKKSMGEDYWPYGLQQNRHTLSTLLGYMKEQGLTEKMLEPEKLFAPETLQTPSFLEE